MDETQVKKYGCGSTMVTQEYRMIFMYLQLNPAQLPPVILLRMACIHDCVCERRHRATLLMINVFV